MNYEEKQQIRRGLAASTLKQVARLLADNRKLFLDPRKKEGVSLAQQGCTLIAKAIEEGRIPEKDWDFLVWVAEPQRDIDSLAPGATFAESLSSGLSAQTPASDSPSTLTQGTLIPEPTPEQRRRK